MKLFSFMWLLFFCALVNAEPKAAIAKDKLKPEIRTSEDHILSTLDLFEGQLNKELQALDQLPSQVSPSLDTIIDDGFDDLNLLDVFEVEKGLGLLDLPMQNEHHNAISTKPLPGTGIKGTEEQIINLLDNSDLMDFKQQNDVWKKKVVKDKYEQ